MTFNAAELQRQIDLIFQKENTSVGSAAFSLTIADPTLVECPLIGCSLGFGTLCGYTVREIVGRNCRFLIEPVPPHLIDNNFRQLCREYIESVRKDVAFRVPDGLKTAWMPGENAKHIRRVGALFSGVKVRTAGGGLFCYQLNARRDGSLFRNMFFLHTVELFGKPYILGFQSLVPNPKVMMNLWGALEGTPAFYEKYQPVQTDVELLRAACTKLMSHLGQVEHMLIKMFAKQTLQGPGARPSLPKAPAQSSWFGCCSTSSCSRFGGEEASSIHSATPVLDPSVLEGARFLNSKSKPKQQQPQQQQSVSTGGNNAGSGNFQRTTSPAPSAPVSSNGRVSPHLNNKMNLEQLKMGITKSHGMPNLTLTACMDGQGVDWAKVYHIAKSMLEPSYGLSDFSNDIMECFPELGLYLVAPDGKMTSGWAGSDEYQRTLGAFFAIYWLCRAHLDGKEGFCFGVDSEWKVLEPAKCQTSRSEWARRMEFYQDGRWDYFQSLMEDADVLCKKHGKWEVNEDRMVALLALTAVHDVLKIPDLAPEVKVQHAPYHGWHQGSQIGDHRIALAYVMDHFPRLLPSYEGLNKEQQNSVKLALAKLTFNHGWLVQAEAPPGAVFTYLRKILRDAAAQTAPVRREDIALYFVHWVTDLAGAEPTPLKGCEKLVAEFPSGLLVGFLRAFEFVERLLVDCETKVMLDYLQNRWKEHAPSPGPLPGGDYAIAKLRLLCMAQSSSVHIQEAFDSLEVAEKKVLACEMARTGCYDQNFPSELIPAAVADRPEGPALLLEHSPAILQDLCGDMAECRLGLLAEIYRKARVLWPASSASCGQTVEIQCGEFRKKSCSQLLASAGTEHAFIIQRLNNAEGVISMKAVKEVALLVDSSQGAKLKIPSGELASSQPSRSESTRRLVLAQVPLPA